jgi:hypothetical protein
VYTVKIFIAECAKIKQNNRNTCASLQRSTKIAVTAQEVNTAQLQPMVTPYTVIFSPENAHEIVENLTTSCQIK